ncbi:hypothetical protein MOQ95_005753, partial [Salmonella enterica]|nr:hypothetical protein [Salmonella enterica]
GYKRIRSSQGEQILGHIRLADGSSPPLGAQVVSEKTGRVAGMADDNGLVYLTGIDPSERSALIVKWAGHSQCHLALPENASLSQGALLLPCSRQSQADVQHHSYGEQK